MSNKIVVLECVYSGAQYFKLKIAKNQHLRFTAGRATLTEDQWQSVQDQLKEMGRSNLVGYQFGPIGSIKNPAVIEPIRTVRGLDKASLAVSEPASAKPEPSIEERIAELDAEREGSPAPAPDHISPEQAASLVADAEENERLLRKQGDIDAAEKGQARRDKARARAAKPS